MTKHEIREAAFIILFQMELTGQTAEEIAECTSEEFEMPVNNAVMKLAENVWSKKEEIDAVIGKYSPSRSVARISKVNLAILRISIYELTYEKEKVPPKVSINEAVELSKAYAAYNDKAFINGVLNSYYKDLGK
ncbi:MAG: transcription antitermination factor NusB [Ruminiclostridium sp.]|nr:transcription antitermination factor NusB [Ruminiclostridium sp.]